MTCQDCSGAGSVPAAGWEPSEDVDNGYVLCPTCKATGRMPQPVQGELAGVAVESVQVPGQTDLLAAISNLT